MIQQVSMANRMSFSKKDKQTKPLNNEKTATKMTPYVDSFKKHAQESKPVLLAVSTGWTLYDVLSKTRSFPKALLLNFGCFFAPVLIASSAILSVIENKKTSKSSIN